MGRHPRRAGVVRAFEAGPDGLDVIAVGGNKPEGGDGVPSDSPWPDAWAALDGAGAHAQPPRRARVLKEPRRRQGA